MPRLHHHYQLIGRKSLLLSLALPFSSFLHSQTQEGSPLNAAPTTLPPQRPNVLYVFPDQFRNSAMGFWRDSLYRSHVRWQGDPVHTPRLTKVWGERIQRIVFTVNHPESCQGYTITID